MVRKYAPRSLSVLTVAAVLLVAGPPLQAFAQSTGRSGDGGNSRVNERYRNAGMIVEAVRGTPVIDGILAPGEWSGARSYTGFTQFQPDPDAPSSQETTAWILYDERNLYFAFDCRQPDHPIQDYISRRDHMQGDPDFVGILIDPFLTWKEGYLFLINPAGIQTETMLGPEGNGDGAWDTLWKASASVDDGGWTAEAAIPWNSLRFTRTDDQTWGINLVRSIGELAELSVYAPIDIGSNNIMTSNATFRGVTGVRPGRSVWFNPYATFRRAHEGVSGGGTRWVEQAGLGYIGADLRMGLSSNLILDMTVNPDFGHIEADAQRVNLTPYELFFEEKRPFFLEGQRIFEMPINLFYSRRIYNPIGGAKLTGQVGSTQVGVVSAYNEPLGSDDSLPYAWQSALRLKQNIGTASYVGAILTSQEVPGQSRTDGDYGYNRNVGIDFDFKPSDRFTVGGQAASYFAPGAGRRKNAFFVAAAYTSRTIISTLEVVDVQRDFEAHLGYVPRPNQMMIEPFVGYRHEADWGKIKWVTPNVRVQRFQNSTSGELVEQRIGPGVSVQLRNNSNFSFDVWVWDVRWEGATRSGTNYTFEYDANQSGRLTGYAGVDVGDGFDYNGDRVLFDYATWGGVTWRPTMRATLSLGSNYIQRNLEMNGGTVGQYLVSSLRAQYQFTRELFGRVYFQRRHDHTGQDEGPGTKRNRIFMNALLGYEIGPGSVMYLAYNHYDTGNRLDAGVADRVFFFKVARLFAF